MSAGIKQHWWDSEGPVILAVSGGSDSMAMLWFFLSFWKKPVIIAHLEHGIRGKSSLEDALFVKRTSEAMKIPFVMERVSVPDFMGKGKSMEDSARILRYDFLARTRNQYNATYVALAHSADDVAETFLHNLSRGSGPYGLTGIPETRDFYIRPLLGFYREELRQILRSRSLDWRDDETNLDTAILRNSIRLNLIPWLSENINPRAKEHIVNTASAMTQTRELEERTAGSLVTWSKREVPFSFISFDIQILRRMGLYMSALLFRKIGRDFGLSALSRERTEKLVNLINHSGRWRFQWHKDIELCAGQGYISLIRYTALQKGSFKTIECNCTDGGKDIILPFWRISVMPVENKKQVEKRGIRQALLHIPVNEGFTIKSLSECSSKTAENLKKEIPWWLHSLWPLIIQKEDIIWSPVFESGKLNVSNYKETDSKYFRISTEEILQERVNLINGIDTGTSAFEFQ